MRNGPEILGARPAASGGRTVIQRLERTDDALHEVGAQLRCLVDPVSGSGRARGTVQ